MAKIAGLNVQSTVTYQNKIETQVQEKAALAASSQKIESKISTPSSLTSDAGILIAQNTASKSITAGLKLLAGKKAQSSSGKAPQVTLTDGKITVNGNPAVEIKDYSAVPTDAAKKADADKAILAAAEKAVADSIADTSKKAVVNTTAFDNYNVEVTAEAGKITEA